MIANRRALLRCPLAALCVTPTGFYEVLVAHKDLPEVPDGEAAPVRNVPPPTARWW